MKKKYRKPVINKGGTVELDADILRMWRSDEFIDLFWEKLRDARKDDSSISYETIFTAMNEKWFNAFGMLRFSSYDSFKILLFRKK